MLIDVAASTRAGMSARTLRNPAFQFCAEASDLGNEPTSIERAVRVFNDFINEAGTRCGSPQSRPMSDRTASEGSIQNGIVDFLRFVLPPDHIVYANANAARRTPGGRAGNGVPGLMPGIPDLSVACPGSRILYFEVKTARGRLSDVQSHVVHRLRAAGCLVAVVTSIDDVERALVSWNIPTRIAKAA